MHRQEKTNSKTLVGSHQQHKKWTTHQLQRDLARVFQTRRCTSAQKQANDDFAQEALAVKVTAIQKSYQQVSDIEEKMAMDQTNSRFVIARPLKPCPHPHIHAAGTPVSRVTDGIDIEMSESHTTTVDVEDNANGTITTKERKAKVMKPALPEVIVAASRKAMPSTHDKTHQAYNTFKTNMLTLTLSVLQAPYKAFTRVLPAQQDFFSQSNWNQVKSQRYKA
ncbi:hypothetical protein J3A83DRAFT_4186303 [Scleroderma citrinum]